MKKRLKQYQFEGTEGDNVAVVAAAAALASESANEEDKTITPSAKTTLDILNSAVTAEALETLQKKVEALEEKVNSTPSVAAAVVAGEAPAEEAPAEEAPAEEAVAEEPTAESEAVVCSGKPEDKQHILDGNHLSNSLQTGTKFCQINAMKLLRVK